MTGPPACGSSSGTGPVSSPPSIIPVTATVQFVQPGPADFSACTEPDGRTSPDCPPLTAVIVANDTPHSPDINDYQVVSTAQLSLRVSDVRVNGMALDVGSSCGSGPVTTAGNPLGYDGVVLTGGDVPGDPEPQYATEVPPSSAGRWTARRMSRRFPAAARAGTWTRCSLRRSPVPGTTSS